VRILKVSQTYYPFLAEGGRPAKVKAIATRLARRGHGVTILTADLGFDPDSSGAATIERTRWGWKAEAGGVETFYLPIRARYRLLTLNPAVHSFCRQRLETFDVAHIYGLYDLLGPTVAFFCRRRGIPYAVEPMGMFHPIARNLWLKHLYRTLFGQKLLRGAHRVIATAEQERQELLEGGVPAGKVAVRRNGIEVPAQLPSAGSFRRQWNIPAETKLVLFLGRLVSKKSPELMLEAFAGWRKQIGRPGAGFLVVAGPDEGDGYRQRLETFSARLGLTDGVLFTGPLYDEAKWAAYQDADVFVLPSQHENFGNAAAEAIGCGTPVIVTERCGIAPLVDHRAGLVVPHDREALQACLTRLLEDEDLRQRLRTGCTEVARALDWEEPLASMETLYAELTAESRRR